jgi:hypothetical protein
MPAGLGVQINARYVSPTIFSVTEKIFSDSKKMVAASEKKVGEA